MPPIGERQVRTHLAAGMPGTRGHYVVEDCQRWCDQNIHRPGKPVGEMVDDPDADAVMEGGASPQLERWRRIRADMAELQLLELKKVLVPREKVRQVMQRFAAILRQCGETLQKQCGPEAHAIHIRAIDEAERELRQLDPPPPSR